MLEQKAGKEKKEGKASSSSDGRLPFDLNFLFDSLFLPMVKAGTEFLCGKSGRTGSRTGFFSPSPSPICKLIHHVCSYRLVRQHTGSFLLCPVICVCVCVIFDTLPLFTLFSPFFRDKIRALMTWESFCSIFQLHSMPGKERGNVEDQRSRRTRG